MYNSGSGNNKIVQVIFTLVKIIMITIANNENKNVTKLDKILDTGNTCFGKYTFLIREALLVIEVIAMLVAS